MLSIKSEDLGIYIRLSVGQESMKISIKSYATTPSYTLLPNYYRTSLH